MSNLEDLYREVILDHYRTPRNKGELPPPATCTEGANPLCGDEIKIFLDVRDGVCKTCASAVTVARSARRRPR